MPTKIPDMPISTPIVDRQGKMHPLWLRHILSLDNVANTLQDQTANLSTQAADLQTQASGLAANAANGPTVAKLLGTYANNSAALAAGLEAGTLYKTANGVVQIVY
jgi:hypothetical protein